MRRFLAGSVLFLLTTASLAAEPNPRRSWREQGPAVILHSVSALTESDRSELAAKGVFVKHPLTGGRYLARVAQGSVVIDERISFVEPLSRQQKIHPSAFRETSRGATWASLNVIFHADVAFEDAREAVLAAGAALSEPLAIDFEPSHRLTVRLAPASLDALAADDRVLTITGPRRFRVQTDNAESAATSHVTELYSAPYGLSGAGVTVSLFELAEAQATHPEFGGRLTGHATGGSASDKQHATHVSGTMGASGVNPAAKGMAPAVAIHQYCVTCGQGDLAWLTSKRDALAPLGVVADNNSWGYVLGWSTKGLPVWNDADVYYGAYDLVVAAPLDDISNSKNVLFVHSAGNDATPPSFLEFFQHYHVDSSGDAVTTKTWCYSLNGSGTDCPAECTGGCEQTRHHDTLPYDTIGVTAAAKNVVTVGALITGGVEPAIVGFSSRGPAKDGRLKPDIVARGYQVLSSIPTNAYGRSNGTSMAAPAVTGIAALLTEQWRKTFAGASPKPAQLKALLLAGAEDLGNPGPDYTFGFGLVNAKSSVDIILADGAQGRRIRNLTVAQGQTQEIPVVVSQAEKLRVLLNWPDPPIAFLGGDDIAAKALVNDLDLSVIDPLGNTTLPYVLSKSAPTENATRGVNTADNVEEVEIATATPGVYRVRVTGTNVAQGPQTAVLITSANTAPPCTDISESNDTPETATGNLVPGALVSGALCTQTDLDHFKFVATKAGAVSVTITTFDTPVRVTLTGTGISITRDVAASSTDTLTGTASSVPNALLLKIEPAGTIGIDPRYTFTPRFSETNSPRRRSVR